MKKTKRLLPFLLTSILSAGLALPLFACETPNDTPNNGTNQNEASVKVLSSSLLDGKVANFLSANGIAIQDKTQAATQSTTKSKTARIIRANADESTTIEQPETELVKQTEDGVQDVHFYDGTQGDYNEWNDAYETHHHDGQACEIEGCTELSDEIAAADETAPTVISLDARVNKLYNAGRFTFMCVSSAVEGEVRLLTEMATDHMRLSQNFFGRWNTWLYAEGHYVSETNHSATVSYMQVKSGDKQGVILVRRSDAEEAYHYANYWSDDFNQSYLIDNETGKTYSLAELPHIYSVQNGVIVTRTQSAETLYRPQIDENGELELKEIQISSELKQKYPTNKYLVDVHGNIVFDCGRVEPLGGANEYGEVREGGFIFTSVHPEVYHVLSKDRNPLATMQWRFYQNAKRYLLGNDGQIYRFDFRGNTNSVPVHVLNAQGEWTAVPNTANVRFIGDQQWFANITINAANQQYLLITQIKDGKSYFANAALGGELPFTRNTYAADYANYGLFVGVAALPTDGSADTGMQQFMSYVTTAQTVAGQSKTPLDNSSIVYRVGDTAFAYEDQCTGELVIWDRATETRQTVKVGTEFAGINRYIVFMADKYEVSCFQANTELGTRYVSYTEKNPTKAWSEYSTSPVENEQQLDAYYELLRTKS